jgi:tetratricopeptide (TPR) repeat protein
MRLTRAAAAARHNLGLVLACPGRLEDALREEVAALRVMEEARDERLTATSRVYLAMIQEMAGDLETAELTARRALAETANLPPLVPRAHAALGRVLMRRGAVNEAAALAEQLAASLRGARIEGGDVYPRLVLAEILLGGLRTDEAATVLRDTKAAIDRAAAHISDDTVRAHFLEDVPENARALELARQLGVG